MESESALQPGPWVFVTTSPTSTRPSKAQRSQMRRRVMREIGYSRRKAYPPSERKRPAQSASIVESQSSDASSCQMSLPTSLEALPVCPTALDHDSRHLIHHMFLDGLPSCFRIYRDRWYPICVMDTAAFDQMLATYALHLLRWHQGREDTLNCLILSHHTKALAAVRLRLKTSDGNYTDDLEGMLIAIAALACYAHLSQDMPLWKLHMAAIGRIIQLSRRLLNKLNATLMALIEWVDSIGSYALDIPPLSKLYLSEHTEANDNDILSPHDAFVPYTTGTEISRPLISAFRALQTMNGQLSLLDSTLIEYTWQNPADVGSLIDPITRRFLSASCRLDPPGSIGACLRSGVMLYLAEFRRRSGVSPVVTDVHIQNLRRSIEDIKKDGAPMQPLLEIWLLTVGAMESSMPSDEIYFHSRLRCCLEELGIASLAQFRGALSRMVWFDSMFHDKLDAILRRIHGTSGGSCSFYIFQ